MRRLRRRHQAAQLRGLTPPVHSKGAQSMALTVAAKKEEETPTQEAATTTRIYPLMGPHLASPVPIPAPQQTLLPTPYPTLMTSHPVPLAALHPSLLAAPHQLLLRAAGIRKATVLPTLLQKLY